MELKTVPAYFIAIYLSLQLLRFRYLLVKNPLKNYLGSTVPKNELFFYIKVKRLGSTSRTLKAPSSNVRFFKVATECPNKHDN